jgi:hypothetical protein
VDHLLVRLIHMGLNLLQEVFLLTGWNRPKLRLHSFQIVIGDLPHHFWSG